MNADSRDKDIEYIYMHMNIPLLSTIWQYSIWTRQHVPFEYSEFRLFQMEHFVSKTCGMYWNYSSFMRILWICKQCINNIHLTCKICRRLWLTVCCQAPKKSLHCCLEGETHTCTLACLNYSNLQRIKKTVLSLCKYQNLFMKVFKRLKLRNVCHQGKTLVYAWQHVNINVRGNIWFVSPGE